MIRKPKGFAGGQARTDPRMSRAGRSHSDPKRALAREDGHRESVASPRSRPPHTPRTTTPARGWESGHFRTKRHRSRRTETLAARVRPLRRQPVRDVQPGNAGKLPRIVGNDGESHGKGMRGDQHVVWPDRCTLPFEMITQFPIAAVCWLLERKDFHSREHRLQLRGQSRGSAPGRSEAQFTGDDDARADAPFTFPDVDAGVPPLDDVDL